MRPERLPHIKALGEARKIEGSDVRHWSHFLAIIVAPTQKFDYLLSTQSLKFAQQFGREFVAMLGFDVILNFTGAGPPVIAEWAFALWLVYVLSMALDLLGPCKHSLASFAGRFYLGAHTTVAVVSGILGSRTFSGSQRLVLGHINMHSNHRKPVGACLAGWEIVLRAQQRDVNRPRNRGHWGSVVDVQRSRGFISITRCCSALMAFNGYFSGKASCRGSG